MSTDVAFDKAKPRSKKTRFNDSQSTDTEMAVSIVRSMMVERLDTHLLRLRDLAEERYGIVDDLFINLVQDIQEALFPEAWAADGDEISVPGMIPRGGYSRANEGHWRLLIDVMGKYGTSQKELRSMMA